MPRVCEILTWFIIRRIGVHALPRFKFRRSRSDSPPQMPKPSSLLNAYSRHGALTSHSRQTRLASRAEPPLSGKNACGSVCAHNARSCQAVSGSGVGPSTSIGHHCEHINHISHVSAPRFSQMPATQRRVGRLGWECRIHPSPAPRNRFVSTNDRGLTASAQDGMVQDR